MRRILENSAETEMRLDAFLKQIMGLIENQMEFTARIPSDFIELFRKSKNTFDKKLQNVYNNDYENTNVTGL